MDYMIEAINSHQEAMEKQRQEVWDEAKGKALEHLFNATNNSELLPKANGNPYTDGTWQHEEWEASYEHYVMSSLGY